MNINKLMICLMLLYSCKPVSVLTDIKKRPILYTENYGVDSIKSIRSEVNKKAWIVYSLSDNNPTYHRCGGRVVHKEMSFMEPMLVIGTKSNGRYLKLIKYDSEILKEEKLSNRKKAAYYGWVEKEQMLLWNTSVADIRTGFKNMSITAMTDTATLFHPKSFIKDDSVKVFSDARLSEEKSLCGLYQIVYKYKMSSDGKKWLIGNQPDINQDNVSEIMQGWIDSRMLEDVGQRVWYEPLGRVATLPDILKISPVVMPIYADSVVTFRTMAVHRTIDPSDNVIYNVNGKEINYHERLSMEEDLHRIHVFFVIELSANMASQLPSIINAIQNMTPFFSGDRYDYTFTVVAGQAINTTEHNMTQVADWFVGHMDSLSSMEKTPKAWGALDKALDMALQNGSSTNLLINIGENVSGGERADTAIVHKLIKSNGRLLGVQLFADESDSYNNYVLQAADMIEGYSKAQIQKKRNLWVFTDQIRRDNVFKENMRNSYMLDFPNRSVTQGMVVFPSKGEFLTADVWVSSVDTLLKQIKADNMALCAAFDRAFASTGNIKDKYDQTLNESFLLEKGRKIDKAYREVFEEKNMPWVSKTGRIRLTKHDTITQPMYLLVTEKELDVIKKMTAELAAMEVDIKGTGRSNKLRIRNIVQVRRQLLPVEGMEKDISVANDSCQVGMETQDSMEYASTRRIRKHIYKTCKHAIKNSGRAECANRRWRNGATISDVQQLYTMFPANLPLLSDFRIWDIRKKEVVPDKALDELITYIKAKTKELDGALIPKNQVLSGKMKYYKVNRTLLP